MALENIPIIIPEPEGTTVGTDQSEYFITSKGTGGQFNLSHTVFGEGGDDIIVGANVDDVLFGGDGNDSINGGGGSDTMTGGEGNDTFRFLVLGGSKASRETGQTDVITDFSTGDKIDIDPAGGGPIKDVIQIENTADGALISFSDDRKHTIELPGVNAEDLVVTPRGTYELSVTIELVPNSGTQSTDTSTSTPTVAVDPPVAEPAPEPVADAPVEPVEPDVDQPSVVDLASFDSVLIGGDGNDVLRTGNSADYIEGGAGDDRMNGRKGDDVMFGGEGDDYLIGHQGSDTMTGGEGADTFDISSRQKGTDVITDFEVGTDFLKIDGKLYDGDTMMELVDQFGTETDDGIMLELDGNSDVMLEGIFVDDFANMVA